MFQSEHWLALEAEPQVEADFHGTAACCITAVQAAPSSLSNEGWPLFEAFELSINWS
jgi:hypothetical protein